MSLAGKRYSVHYKSGLLELLLVLGILHVILGILYIFYIIFMVKFYLNTPGLSLSGGLVWPNSRRSGDGNLSGSARTTDHHRVHASLLLWATSKLDFGMEPRLW